MFDLIYMNVPVLIGLIVAGAILLAAYEASYRLRVWTVKVATRKRKRLERRYLLAKYDRWEEEAYISLLKWSMDNCSLIK